jgi:predicted alpha/beta-hydrolase family hydrolase
MEPRVSRMAIQGLDLRNYRFIIRREGRRSKKKPRASKQRLDEAEILQALNGWYTLCRQHAPSGRRRGRSGTLGT